MVLPKIARAYQIIIYLAVFALVVFFFVYFFRQASVTPLSFDQLQVTVPPANQVVNQASININLDLFGTEKFMQLRSESAPTSSFQTGKRNPFAPQ